MTAPKRVRMTRNRPWRAENPDAVIVARPSKWGNPFKVGKYLYLSGPKAGQVMTAADAVQSFRGLVTSKGGSDYREAARRDLRGRDLACWCPLDQPCHADVLLELANGDLT